MIYLKHSIPYEPKSQRDTPSMAELLLSNPTKEHLLYFSKCDLHFKAFNLSDIFDVSGFYTTDDAWLGRSSSTTVQLCSLPTQCNLQKMTGQPGTDF
jgi:hypothetical protein